MPAAVYARIADKTVAKEYFAVTEKVQPLYDKPRQLPSDDEGSEMRKLPQRDARADVGNRYCATFDEVRGDLLPT